VVALGGSDRSRAEIMIIGREGMTGVAVTLGVDRSPHETFVQVEGHGRWSVLNPRSMAMLHRNASANARTAMGQFETSRRR